ncbi:MAG: hypothetical protein NTX22_09405 [Ignavibacteriales bacterium]|nr:hypothetical protein [Ignavibacteriales bacterium]
MKLKKYMPLTILLLQLLFLSLPIGQTGCNTNEPNTQEEYVEPGSRNYEWTVDTLNIPFNTLTRIWGSSPTDVWATGGGGGLDKTIWHFDGTKWSTDNISKPIVPTSIFGFGTNDVWLGGDDGLIWHYNGSKWSQHTKFEIQNYSSTGLENIWGDAPDNVYAVGYAADGNSYKGIIMHYDGVKWQEVKILSVKISFVKIRRAKNDNPNYYLLGFTSNLGEDSTRIYEFDGKNIREIYAGRSILEEYGNFEVIGGKIYFQKGRGIYRFINGNFNLTYYVNEPNFGLSYGGRSLKDLFLRMYDGIAHYNGTDLQYLYKLSDSNIAINGLFLVFDKHVFFMAENRSNGLNYIIRGKIKEN